MATDPTDFDLPEPSFLAELKRRRVHRAAIAYAAVAFALAQGLDLLVEAFLWPPAVFRWGMIAMLAGFPVAIAVAWVYDFDRGRLRRTGPAGENRGAAPARFVAGLGAIVLVGGLLWWVRPAPVQGNVLAGADVIAVLPFRANGPGTDGLDEGMMDLLSTNLDEVGDIRTLDPALVLREWERRAEGGTLAATEALELGRATGAGSVLAGQLSIAGGTARLTAALRSTDDGADLAEVEVEGPEAQLFQLVDSLSVELLREVWRSRSPMPNLEIASITTADPAALRDFLEGEAYRRRAQWDSAQAALGRAVDADSTFALAAVRLSSVIGWRDGGDPEAVETRTLALRHAERLPAQMRRVFAAGQNWQSGRFRVAEDSLLSVLADDPNDALAWFLLGEVYYHGKTNAGYWDLPSDSIVAAFDRSLEAQPQDATALIHPIGLALHDGDEAGFYSRLARFESIAGAESAAPIRAAGDLLFRREGRPAEVWSNLATELVALLPEFSWGILLAEAWDPVALGDSLWAGRAEMVGMPGPGWRNMVSLLQVLGRIEDARILAAEQVEPVERAQASVEPVLLGVIDGDAVSSSVLTQAGAAGFEPLVRRIPGLWRGDAEAGTAVVGTLDAIPDPPAELRPIIGAFRAWARSVRGDTSALSDLEALLRDWPAREANPDSYPVEFFLLPLLRLQANQPETAELALERLRSQRWISPLFLLPRHVAEAEALETLGRPDEARESYQRVIDWLREADAGAGYYHDLSLERIAAIDGS